MHPNSPFGLRFALSSDRVQISSVVAARERIADAQLEKLGLQLLPLGDVDEDSVTVLVAGLWIDGEKGAVRDRPHLAVAPRQL